MSRRITRSAARLATSDEESSPSTQSELSTATHSPPTSTQPDTDCQRGISRKRKAAQLDTPVGDSGSNRRRTKKVRIVEAERPGTPAASRQRQTARTSHNITAQSDVMSSQDEPTQSRRTSSSRQRRQPSPPGTSTDTSPQHLLPPQQSRRKSSRKNSGQGSVKASTSVAPDRRKKASRKEAYSSDDQSSPPAQTKDDPLKTDLAEDGQLEPSGASDAQPPTGEPVDEDDQFASQLLSRISGNSSITNTLRALGSMMSGMGGRLRNLLEQLRAKDDPSVQMIALTDLSELLLISNEDNLVGHFAPDQFVKELVVLMQPNDYGDENPEMMLLACRCIANLMEAIPSATASVVYGGAVPVLCQKLLEIHYIDLAEQALSTLEKISTDFPASIVREGGLTACLTYLDFFATSTQRTAVTTAANCCRGIPEESFPVIKDVMPILLNVLASNDQKVVEQGSLCVCRIIESFKWQESKLEDLVSADLLKAVLRLLLPGTTNLIGASIHTQFLRALSIAARASPRISVELLRLNVVDTLYQILAGVSPPVSLENAASLIDKNIIMQALIRSPKDQVHETLNVICEILPSVSDDGLTFINDLQAGGLTGLAASPISARTRSSPNDKRVKLLQDCNLETRRFAVILFPTLMHAYTSTVNTLVRQKVLTAQLKMLSNFSVEIIEEALLTVPFASHIASLLTQQDDTTIITCALQIAEMLINRVGSIYKHQFLREGVVAEITKLAERTLKAEDPVRSEKKADAEQALKSLNSEVKSAAAALQTSGARGADNGDKVDDEVLDDGPGHIEDGEADDDDEDADPDANQDDEDDQDDSDSSSEPDSPPSATAGVTSIMDTRDMITMRARKFMASVEALHIDDTAKEARAAVDKLGKLGQDLVAAYQKTELMAGQAFFDELATHFSDDSLGSITSYEMRESGIIEALLQVFADGSSTGFSLAGVAFLKAFMTDSGHQSASVQPNSSPFKVLLRKLQDLLSRTERFDIITVHQSSHEGSRHNATSLLAKQLRLRLTADNDSEIPAAYRNIMVSIHAIATFRALDDYLRPRIAMAEKPDFLRAHQALFGGLLNRSSSLQGGDKDGQGEKRNTPLATTSANHVGDANELRAEHPATPPPRQRRNPKRTSSAAKMGTQEGSDVAGNDAPLECEDETKLSSGDDDDDSVEATMDTILDDINDEMDVDSPEESPVNMEVVNSGKVIARKEDGTRIATPQKVIQSSGALPGVAQNTLARELLTTPTTPSRSMSYASALQRTPQDWHIEFSIDGQAIANDTTIYRAVHFDQAMPQEISARAVWSSIHKISFRRVSGPPAAEVQQAIATVVDNNSPEHSNPPSLAQHPQTATILQLMSIMHTLNSHLRELAASDESIGSFAPEPLSTFINTKMTAKLNRQLEEPLIVASNCLPSWVEDVARLYPFLFPFESRHLFLQSTSFGYSRSMARWQSGQNDSSSRRHRDERPFLGRNQRQKVRISRSRILESALKVMDMYGSSPSILEVEYFEEVGTGLGPTLEFYSTISKEFSKKRLKLWRENESDSTGEYAFGLNGLFPAPMSDAQANDENGKRVLQLFRLLGKFVARSMLDSRLIDISFNAEFFRVGVNDTLGSSLAAIGYVDKALGQSLKDLAALMTAKQVILRDTRINDAEKQHAIGQLRIKNATLEDLGLDFTLPGYPSVELVPGGADKDVSIDNVEQYMERIVDVTLRSGVQKQVDAFRTGFSQVFPYAAVRAFTPEELVMLFGRTNEDWSLETLMDSIKADHGFNLDSQTIRNLLHIMSDYDESERRDFLQFVTGSPKLPIGGFKSLTPMFTVVCKPSEAPLTPDDYLPSVMTCVNYLKMPDYTSAEVLRQKLAMAVKEGQGAFHLS